MNPGCQPFILKSCCLVIYYYLEAQTLCTLLPKIIWISAYKVQTKIVTVRAYTTVSGPSILHYTWYVRVNINRTFTVASAPLVIGLGFLCSDSDLAHVNLPVRSSGMKATPRILFTWASSWAFWALGRPEIRQQEGLVDARPAFRILAGGAADCTVNTVQIK